MDVQYISFGSVFESLTNIGGGSHDPTAATMSHITGYADADSDERKTSFLMFIYKEMYIVKQEWKWD